MMHLSVAKDFSPTPGARSREEGRFSGEEFLDKVLAPAFHKALEAKEQLLVDLDGTAGYATSFLEAAFGGLAREMSPEVVMATIKFKSDEEPYLIEEIEPYIRDANFKCAG